MNFLSASLIALVLHLSSAGASEFDTQVAAAAAGIQALGPETDALVLDGRIEQAEKVFLVKFPDGKRNAAEAFVLGETLFHLSPKLSYALHQEAARGAPGEVDVQLMWGCQQHRAGEYAGALEVYDRLAKIAPDFAPAHGLAADCLIRLGRTKEAVERWQKSEDAHNGKLTELESFLCTIYQTPNLFRQHADLYRKATGGDFDATIALIVLDVGFESDWWNKEVNRAYLEHDLPLLGKLPDNPRSRAAKGLGEAALKFDASSLPVGTPDEKSDVPKEFRAFLEKRGFLFDAEKTIPEDPAVAYLLFELAGNAGAITRDEIRDQFGATLRARGLRLKSAPLFEIVASTYGVRAGLLETEKAAWDATGDPQFLAAYLDARHDQGDIHPDDPVFGEALAKFPEDRRILSVAIAAYESPPAELLVQGIKAEYRRLSVTGGEASPYRARAAKLRSYFQRLAKITK